MLICIKWTEQICGPGRIELFSTLFSVNFQFDLSIVLTFMTKMSEYEEEKDKYLKRTVMQRKTGNTVTLNYVDNWQEYYVKHLPSLLACNASFRKGYTINTHANDVVSLFFGDVTKLLIDVIVYATSVYMNKARGEPVNYDIHEEAGEWLDEELKLYPDPEVAEVIMTGAYRLPAKYIFHVYGSPSRMREHHRLCYKNCLDLAREHKLKTIAFPCISTGLFGFPEPTACVIALETIREYIDNYPNTFERILFYMDHRSDSRVLYELHMPYYFPVQ